ncbi:hypothetical protein DL770_006472 [Monosporascus sp. CRB-9-2]|nr:hypothetical protein DL770_006472 [Monosporascus sp. CRB-9-2]
MFYGASAVLCYGVIEPWAVLAGYFISDSTTAELGCRFIATAIAAVIMQLTKTTHPPVGAMAMLHAIDPNINRFDILAGTAAAAGGAADPYAANGPAGY